MKKLILLVFLSFSYAGKMPYEVSDDSFSFAQLYLSYEYERNDDIRLYYKYKDKILSKKLDRTLSRLVIKESDIYQKNFKLKNLIEPYQDL